MDEKKETFAEKDGSDESLVDSRSGTLPESKIPSTDELVDRIVKRENFEEHYSSLYKDLPEDVVKMLMSTHPIYGDKAKKKLKKDDKKELKEESTLVKPKKLNAELEYEDIPDDISTEKESTESKTESSALTETPSKSKEKNMKKYEDDTNLEYEEYEEVEDDSNEEYYDDEDSEDDEKEFLYSLFSRKYSEDSSGAGKYIVTGVLTIALVVCIIGMTVNIIQNRANKKLVTELTEENKSYERELTNLGVSSKALKEEKESLQNEVESLRAELASSNTQSTEPQSGESDGNTGNTDTIVPSTSASKPKKTYKVASGDTLWKISIKQYGTGKQEYVDAIMKANNLKNPNDLKVGATLTIPDI